MRNKGLISLFVLGLAVLIVAPAGAVFAAPPETPAGSFVNAGDVPDGSTLVLNITHKVINDIDSGEKGYWALDNYNRSVQVWEAPDGTYYAVAKYVGKWQTFAGALSPGPDAGVVQGSDGEGTFEGGYTLTFTADGMTATPQYKTKGNIGTFDYGGTQADVEAGIGPAPNPFRYLNAYFVNVGNTAYVNWGWTYKYQSQRWNNFDYGNTGDIVIP